MTDIDTTIDIQGLIDDGHLDLESVFAGEVWARDEDITTYIACVFGDDGDQPGEVEVILQKADAYGITAYRWAEVDGSGVCPTETGSITLDASEAIAGGEEYAAEEDQAPDLDDLLDRIVDTGYFGDADADDIRAICEAATTYSQGYLLLPKGQFVGHPVSRMWTTNGYLQCEHVALDATYPSVELAAAGLLAAIEADAEICED